MSEFGLQQCESEKGRVFIPLTDIIRMAVSGVPHSYGTVVYV